MRKLRQEVNVSLESVTHDIDVIKKEFYRHKGNALVKALEKNHFDAYYVENKEAAAEVGTLIAKRAEKINIKELLKVALF